MLLDTHIWIWLLEGSDNLPAHIKRRIEAEPASILLSPVSVWEATILAERGRVKVHGDPAHFFRRALSMMPFKEAPLTYEVAIKSRELPFLHDDPADRFIAATALVYQVTLATVDQRLKDLSWLKIF